MKIVTFSAKVHAYRNLEFALFTGFDPPDIKHNEDKHAKRSIFIEQSTKHKGWLTLYLLEKG